MDFLKRPVYNDTITSEEGITVIEEEKGGSACRNIIFKSL